jgi:MerR family transcriptional regulator, light-induced transcriptional regulator
VADSDLTLQEAADELGVHYMTAYRYVRLGLLSAAKSGGTWRVTRSDLDVFRSGGPLSPQPEGGGRRRAPWAERLEARLIAGDARGAWGVIEAALTAGTELDEVYLDVISPAMASIGEQWQRGDLDISVEHRATGIAMRLIGRLGPRFVRRGRSRGTVVIGAPAGEYHAIAAAMLADLLRNQGWEVSDLGADTPAASFVHAARNEADLVAVGVSVSTPSSLDSCAEAMAQMRRELPNILLVAGGPAVTDAAHARALGADAYAASAAEFGRLLDEARADAADAASSRRGDRDSAAAGS